MKRGKIKSLLLSVMLVSQLLVPNVQVDAATTIYDNKIGTQDGYNYELWKDYGTTSMTLNSGGTFSCQWSNIGNALFRKGVKFDSTKTYQQIGNITCEYGCNYQPNGNSYLCVYGWTVDPLIEYYIVDSWGSWRPPGSNSRGQITVDGGTYDVYETTRYNQPSIQGNTTFQQVWSVRTSKRTSGTISVAEHFKAWDRMGLRTGKLYEACLTVEGYQSSGSADVYKNVVTVGGASSNNNQGNNNQGANQGNNNGNGTNQGSPAQGTKIECENMTIGGQYAGKIGNPFNGVALYGNNDKCSVTQNFGSGTHDFTLRACSNNSNMARVDLKIGGQTKGTFYYGDNYPAEYTIKNVSHGTGNQTIELVVTADDGQWDAYLDYLVISGNDTNGAQTQQPTQQPTQEPATQQPTQEPATQQPSQPSTGSNAKYQCESMTISGQYAGKISSPFNGVALYANNDKVSKTQTFGASTHDFTLRGCSNNNNMARVDLIIAGQNKGTFYFGDNNPAEYTIRNVSHATGNVTLELVVNADDGQWDAYIDSLTISSPTTGENGTTSNNNNQSQPVTPQATPSGKLVALTFDDGPSSTTNQVLDVLERNGVVATFFLIGQNINNNTASIMQRQVKMGCELASHSYTHQDMGNMAAWQVQQEISRTNDAIKNVTGTTPKFFRAPYLSTSYTMFSNINLTFIQGITCDDWMGNVSAWQRANTVINNVQDGTIVLLHDFQGNTNTVEALQTIITNLKNQGYTFVTVSDLFKYKGVTPTSQGNKVWTNVR